eukprot:530378-Prorocentrum_minimum.AAC.2
MGRSRCATECLLPECGRLVTHETRDTRHETRRRAEFSRGKWLNRGLTSAQSPYVGVPGRRRERAPPARPWRTRRSAH